ncbi:MAG: M56 family metallopeptidase, partial [Acidobacteriota bacterium]|nr:M56 family metallopeptidase [Acidobacteriota bacterium]
MWENLGEIFNWVLRGSLYSVAVVFIIVLTQKLTRRALSARWSCALWLILLARLILPTGAGPETNWSLWNLTAPERWTQENLWTQWTAPDSGWQEAAGATIPMAIPAVSAGDQGKSLQSGENRLSPDAAGFFPFEISQTLFVIWLSGVLVMISSAAFINLRLWNSVRGLNPTTDSKLLELFEDCKRQMRIKTMTGLVVTDRVENPFLFGFIRPRVLLPAGLVRQISSDQLRCVLLHELAHL